MKRVIAPLGLCLALAACGQSGDSAITPPEPAEPSSAVIPPGTRSSPAPTTTVVSGAGDTYGLPYGIELDFPHTLRVERRSEEHTSELQSLMRISYAVFFLTKKNITNK